MSGYTFNFSEVAKKLRKAFQVINDMKDRQLKWLAGYGWYLCDDLKIMDIADELINASGRNQEEIDRRFEGYYEEILDSKTVLICKLFPDRRKILEEAQKAFKQEMYYSAVLLYLSQADGIVDSDLYSGRQKDNLKEKLTGASSIFATPVLVKTTIDRHSSKQNKGELNRNTAFHGLDIEYGTKRNALKAFSLLCLVSDSLNN